MIFNENGKVITHRVNVNVSDECKQWYMMEASTMGMAMSQLMSYVLATHYKNQKNAEAVRHLSEASNSGDLQEMQSQLLEIMTAVKEMEREEK